MDPMTDQHNLSDVSSFYDALSAEYDLMTGFDNRFIRERPFFRMFVDRYQISTAVDAGCGTGFHSLLLAQLGVSVTAVDISGEMLAKVAAHAKELSLPVKTIRARFEDLSADLTGLVDAVFSLGNSLAHILSAENLLSVLKNFHAILKPGGALFLQVLNYDRIMKVKERIQNTKQIESKTFVRFYDYNEGSVVFNILEIDKSKGLPEEKLISVSLRPVSSKDLIDLLEKSGFRDIQVYGGISLQGFLPEQSQDLVVIAKKPE
ncbi:MAG: class I SAM-dependent methyltransferase [Bacteroidota bacterium]